MKHAQRKGMTGRKKMAGANKIVLAMCICAVLFSCGTSPSRRANGNSQTPAAEGQKKQSQDDAVVLPEVVRSKSVHIANGLKTVTVSNANGEYLLSCNIQASSGCITPIPGKNYQLFNKNTRFKRPGAKDFITLAFVQDWTVSYKEGENIGLVPEEPDGAGPAGFGMYTLDSWSGSR